MRRFVLVLGLWAAAACNSEQKACDDYVSDLETCYDDHCDGGDSPFCGCWNDGMDLDITTCDCTPLGDLAAVCDFIDAKEVELNGSVAAATVDNVCN